MGAWGKIRAGRGERGQASIMIAMMLMTFILFFTFVINTGMLVNAKINLQNAADLAAYSGAAVQARQLNQISFLNYEMRRQLKKLIFRYYVIGNMSQDTFPRPGATQTGHWSPDGHTNYGVPTVCIIFRANDNFCHIVTLQAITVPPATFGDSINDTLRDQLKAIEGIRRKNCKSIGHNNLFLSTLWLYNTDPSFTTLMSSALTDEQKGAANTTKGLAFGMGLVPRELILSQRIKTLQGYVNTAAQTGVNLETLSGIQSDQDPAAFERTIQAFYSAYYTLGNHTFDGGAISLDEILPPAGSNANLLQLKKITSQLTVWAVDLYKVGQNPDDPWDPSAPNDDNKGCASILRPISTPPSVPLGFVKDPTILTYYAIRVRATAKTLFSPFGDLTLKAYAAAQPFGSRIGPEGEGNMFTYVGPVKQPNGNASPIGGNSYWVPNLAIKKGGSNGDTQGFQETAVLTELYKKFSPEGQNGGSFPSSIGVDDTERAYQAAMVPNPVEGNLYNIISDFVDDPFVRYFDSELKYAFWAPILPPDKATGTAVGDTLKAVVGDLWTQDYGKGSAQNNKNSSGGDPTSALQATLLQGITSYVSALKTATNTEDGEGINIVRLRDPFRTPPSDAKAPAQRIHVGAGVSMDNDQDYRTSWAHVNDPAYRAKGRVGYSVKFVSFDSLTNSKSSTNGRDKWSNEMDKDTDASLDIPNIQH